MKTATVERSVISFRGVLRTSRGSVVLVAVEKMPISPVVAPRVATNLAYDRPVEPPESGEGVVHAVTAQETIDYYPYGQARVDTTVGSFNGEKRNFIGQQYDAAPALDYLNARYYNPAQGEFTSQDPMFLKSPKNGDLTNPQSLNAYTYALDNPITLKDPSGKGTLQQQIQGIINRLEQIIGELEGSIGGGGGGYFAGTGNVQSTVLRNDSSFNGEQDTSMFNKKTIAAIILGGNGSANANQQQGNSSGANLSPTIVSAPGAAPTSVIQPGRPVDVALIARYQLATGLEAMAKGFDSYGAFGESDGAATTIALALVAGNLIAPGFVDTAVGGLEITFYGAQWTGGTLDRVANYINPIKQ